MPKKPDVISFYCTSDVFYVLLKYIDEFYMNFEREMNSNFTCKLRNKKHTKNM